jgi:hypothetical protein
MRIHHGSLSLVAAFAVGCAAAPAPAPSAPADKSSAEPAPVESAVPEESEQPEPAGEVGADLDPEDRAALEEPDPATTPREIKYVLSNEGLRVEVAGVRLVPRAEPVRKGAGWGVRVRVEALVTDAQSHSLLDPKQGPLAFAGRVIKDGRASPFGDQRDGDGELVLASGAPKSLERTWPAAGDTALVAGQTLELEVGLWGLGESAATRRPVRKLFKLKMIAGKQQPQPVILPPED